MNMATKGRRVWGMVCLSMLALSASAASGQTVARYRVVDLGSTPASSPTGISSSGNVSGLYFGSSGLRRGFAWQNGVFADIGTLGGVTHALAVNDAGTVVGLSVDSQGRQQAVRFQNGALNPLPMLHGGRDASANDINSAGWIAGTSDRQFANERYMRAAVWRNGTVIDLGTFGGECAEAKAVNELGQVVGWAWTPLPQRHTRAFLWSDATGMIDLGTLGGPTARAKDINDDGVVVGSSQLGTAYNPSHAFMWSAQVGMIDLGAPSGASDSSAFAINNAGVIVGDSFLPMECRLEPLLWQDGQMYFLNALLEPGSGWIVGTPRGINDQGVIAAIARQGNGTYRAVLLVPLRPTPVVSQPAPR